jgi:hypothetical protein
VHATPHAFAAHVGLPVPAVGAGHALQAAPPVTEPHWLTLWAAVTQPLAAQHPVAHDAALHATHAPA